MSDFWFTFDVHFNHPRTQLTAVMDNGSNVLNMSLLRLVLLLFALVTLLPSQVRAPFPPDDPRAVFNAFVIPWWFRYDTALEPLCNKHWCAWQVPSLGSSW